MAFRLTLAGAEASAPAGAVIGVITEDRANLELATAAARQAGDLVVDPTYLTPLGRLRLIQQIEKTRRAGGTALVATSDLDLLAICDELWWLEDERLRHKGSPNEVLELWTRDAFQRFRQVADSQVTPRFRLGDGRAELISIATFDAVGQPSATWTTGSAASIQVKVRFAQPVDDPVVGIMIRTHMGMEVFGTNTELEGIKLGPVEVGAVRDIRFSFLCRLCPQMYVVTAASHDPDGVWHDWVEDAIAVTVGDVRYTAGVVNLEATVTVSGS